MSFKKWTFQKNLEDQEKGCENSMLIFSATKRKQRERKSQKNLTDAEVRQKWRLPKHWLIMAVYYIDLSIVHGIIFILPCIIFTLFKCWTKIVAKRQAELITRQLNEELVKLVWISVTKSVKIINGAFENKCLSAMKLLWRYLFNLE